MPRADLAGTVKLKAMQKRAVVLLSGGLDSATVAAIAQAENFEVHALTVAYGQRHAVELAAARRVAKSLALAGHRILDAPLGDLGGSALTDNIAVPKGRDLAEIERDVPVTYVPARNTVLLAYALAYAEILGAADLFIGVTAVDYSGYPDCRPAFVEAFERLAQVATQSPHPFRVHAPLIDLGKAEIVRKGLALGVDYGLTHSCYDPGPEGRACGACDACLLRQKGFAALGLEDPALADR